MAAVVGGGGSGANGIEGRQLAGASRLAGDGGRASATRSDATGAPSIDDTHEALGGYILAMQNATAFIVGILAEAKSWLDSNPEATTHEIQNVHLEMRSLCRSFERMFYGHSYYDHYNLHAQTQRSLGDSPPRPLAD